MNEETVKTFQTKLEVYRAQEKRQVLVTALYRWLLLFLPLCFFALAVNALFLIPSTGRVILLLLAMGFLVTAFVRNVAPPLYRLLLLPNTPSLNQIALQVGEHYPTVHDRLANAFQLLRKLERNPEAYSADLIQAAFYQVAKELQDQDFGTIRDERHLRLLKKQLFAVVAIFMVLSLGLVQRLNTGALRLFYPLRDFQPSASQTFTVLPGHATVIKGQDLVIRVVPREAIRTLAELKIHKNGQEEIVALHRGDDDTLRYRFVAVRDSFSYCVQTEKVKSAWYEVAVIELAMLRALQVKLYPPSYTRQDPFLLPENLGDISSLRGTRVEVRAECNKRVDSAWVSFQSGKRLAMDITDRRLTATFLVEQDDRYRFCLMDRPGLPAAEQIEYHIRAISDQYPFVRIVIPGQDVELTQEMQLPLLIEAQDDYGLSRMQLRYQVLAAGETEVDSARFQQQDIPAPLSDQMRVAMPWDLSESPLLPDETLVYGVRVYDNDAVSGPKSGHSEFYRARFPSLYEMYQDLAQRQEQALDQMESIYERGLDLNKKVEELQREYQRETQLDWQKKQQLDDTREQQEEIQQGLEQVSHSLAEMVQKMEQNDLVSLETLKKYETLQQLIEEIMTPELQKVMQQLAEAMQKLDPNLLKKTLEELQLSVQDVNKSLDRSIALLKKFKMEQQLDQAIRTVQKMAEEQKRISEQAQPSGTENLAAEQQALQDQLEQLDKLLQSLEQEMERQPGLPQEQIQRARELLTSTEMSQQMAKMKNLLAQKEAGDSQSCSSSIQQKLAEAENELQQAKDKLSGAQRRKAMEALQRGMRDLLELSQMQENLLNRSEQSTSASQEIQKIAEEQQSVAAGLDRVMEQIFSASRESMYIDPRISSALGQAVQNMSQSLRSLEERNQAAATGRQGQALASLNRAAKQMHQALQAMMSGGGSGMSMEQFMQQMQAMAAAQQGINQQTEALGGQMGLAQQAAMARLAAEQAQLRKTMEQLAQEAGDLSGAVGSLDKMVEDMKQVEKDLGRQVTRTTIQRQQQILSRMLDSQKSMREREYDRKRKAETGKSYSAKSPKELPTDLGEHKKKWQQDLLRAKKEGYTRDYLELIKQYYEALFEKETVHP